MADRSYLVGLDDTDYGDSIGTGALARELSLFLVRTMGARSTGITRHQLLVHPDVPYTSHNSAACLGIVLGGEPAGADERLAILDKARRLIELLEHPGADPGVCVVAEEDAGELAAFGRRAQQEVLRMAEAFEACARDMVLEPLGGTGQGVIGALAACGLRASGQDGRFIALRGIRDQPDQVTAAQLLERTGVEAVLDGEGQPVDAEAPIHTRDWVRPDLRQGRIVLTVRRQAGGSGYEIVRPARRQDGGNGA